MSHPKYSLKLLNTEPSRYDYSALSSLSNLLYVDNIETDRDLLLKCISDYDILLICIRNTIDKEILSRSSRLKCIVTPTTGLNHIDIDCAQEMGIDILSLKGEVDFLSTITATAELAWGLILSLVRNINPAHQSVIDGFWSRDLFYGNELRGMTIGIVGYGRLGTIIAKFALAFGMHVIAFDKIPIDSADIRQVSLQLLASQSDVISVHLDLNSSTVGILDSNFFANVKKGSYFVNTSRGEIVDERSLLLALKNGTIAGAALDVLSSETSHDPSWLVNSPIYKYAVESSNLLLTPHIGGVTHQSVMQTNNFMIQKLDLYLSQQLLS